jgi:hypothetical protein
MSGQTEPLFLILAPSCKTLAPYTLVALRRVRVVAESAYELRHVRQPACIGAVSTE